MFDAFEFQTNKPFFRTLLLPTMVDMICNQTVQWWCVVILRVVVVHCSGLSLSRWVWFAACSGGFFGYGDSQERRKREMGFALHI